MVTTVRTAVYLFLWLAVCQVRGNPVPLKMNETIRTLRQHYGILPKVGFGETPFIKKEQSGTVEERMLLMGSVLGTYEKLFQHMLKQLPSSNPREATGGTDAKKRASSDVREGLKYLQEMVHGLKIQRYSLQEDFLKKLKDIQHIQVDNVAVQKRALWDLSFFYQEAHELIDKQQRKRRRRQARRFPQPKV